MTIEEKIKALKKELFSTRLDRGDFIYRLKNRLISQLINTARGVSRYQGSEYPNLKGVAEAHYPFRVRAHEADDERRANIHFKLGFELACLSLINNTHIVLVYQPDTEEITELFICNKSANSGDSNILANISTRGWTNAQLQVLVSQAPIFCRDFNTLVSFAENEFDKVEKIQALREAAQNALALRKAQNAEEY